MQYVLMTSLAIIFLHACTKEGMILSFVPRVLHRLPDWIKKPLFECPVCMTSVWGIPMAMFMPIPVYLFPVFILAVGGCNLLIAALLTHTLKEWWL